MNTHIEERLAYGVKEAARTIGVSQSKFWDMIRKKEVKATRLGGRTLITVRELSRLLGTPVPVGPGGA
ncbi:excise, DNA binding domain, excisionase family [Rhabdaerophilaceae bacterium]